MTDTFIERARANRRAALASLNARTATGANVVALFDQIVKPRLSVPEFHSTRTQNAPVPQPQPVLVLTDPVAA